MLNQFKGRRTRVSKLPERRMDKINPPHYKTGTIETILVIEDWKLGFNLGNAVKYISRADHKGERLDDLRKAQWYLNREIENEQKRQDTFAVFRKGDSK